MSIEDILLPSPPPDSSLRGHMSGLFSRGIVDKLASNVFSDPPDSDGDPAGRKRVGFLPWTTNILEPQLSTPDSEVPPSLKSLPPSRDCQLTVRPILKPSLSSQSVFGLDGQNEKKSPLENMDSLLRNLAVNERSSSVDAYQTMTSLIRTYDEAPEQDVLQKKTTQLQKHIKRDLTVLDIPIDNQPSEERLSMGNLIVSAMKVLVTMVWSPAYSPYLSDDFRAWSVDRAIRVLKDHLAPKNVLLHYMHLLATQNFRSSIITQTRVQRILEALHELTEHISGKAVVAERLLVYQKLIQQSKQAMKARPDMWVKHLFTAMGHSFKEVRSNALSAGTEACGVYSGPGSVAVAARAALAEVTNDRTLSASVTNRLERILAAKDEANQIPQIWTLVILLCNGGQQKLDSWQQLPDWLKLIQRCFNSSDTTVRNQAFLAWNRLYLIARPHEASEKVVSMLAKPAMVQLERTVNNQASKGARGVVISSYCMLMYYAFRPSASPSQYSRMWNEFVVKLMTRSFLSSSGSNCDLSCRILAALFYSSVSKTRVWNENRANENAALDPQELPSIDCKWVRSKTASILSIFQLVVDYSSFGLSESMSDQAYAPQAWRNLMRAIKESTSKEITPSADTKSAFSSIVNFLRPVSDEDESSTKHPVDRARRLSLLAKIAIDELGLLNMLQAVENSTLPVNTLLFKSLIEQSLQAGDDMSGQQPSKEQVVDRCVHLLNADLEFVGQAEPTLKLQTRHLVLEQARHIMGLLEHDQLFHTLSTLQSPIARLIEDANGLFAGDTDADNNATEYRFFCDMVFSILGDCESTKQAELSKILEATASSTHAWLRSLRSGPSKEPLQHEDPSEEFMAQSEPNAQIDPISLPDLQQAEPSEAAKSKSGRKSVGGGSARTSSRSRKTKKKPRHDDSQIEFVPVESSPPDYAFESQLLTARQKEVRARQIAEPAVTFANIRSSPSVGKKGTPKTDKKSERCVTPELPGTPTLPPPCDNEDENQPPTPTPRRRKSRRLDLQPEITSSPPSVIGDGRSASSMNITSSPVKDVTEADDAISFEEVNKEIIADAADDPVTLDHMRQQQETANHRSSSEQVPDDATNVDKSASKDSTEEEYETAQAARSSPTTYSDEYDALAASQLSHSLEETSFMTSRLDEETTPQPSRATRKRKREQQESSSSKKRKSEVVAESAARPEAQDSDMEDTIYVTVEKATPSSSRITRARAAQEASDLSQVSQKSSASVTPKNRKSTGRRRGRPRKKTQSQSSREPSPPTQVLVSAASQDEIDEGPAAVDEEMIEVQAAVGSPSLGSEVAETAESKPSGDLLVDKTSDVVTNDVPAQGEAALVTVTDAEVDIAGAEDQIGLPHQAAAIPTSIVHKLQGVLDTLNNNPAVDLNLLGADLAAIHSLCFKIGLKAQELVSP